MPLYTYECDKCHRQWDEFRMVADRDTVVCCGKLADRHKVYNAIVTKDMKYRDNAGQPIWFPKDERPYYDKALDKTFNSKKEKYEFMRENKIVMDGSDNKTHLPVEAGDTRAKSFRKLNKMED